MSTWPLRARLQDLWVSSQQWSWVKLTLSLFLLVTVADYIRVANRAGLRTLPGPRLARYTKLFRVLFVWDGKSDRRYIKLHEKYGRIVRTGPNHVSISDPAVIPTIYGITTKYLKTIFYTTMGPRYEGAPMETVFSTRDPVYHRNLKTPVASKFSMTSIRTLEPMADECSNIFVEAMNDLAGQAIDLGTWLQWYAFDVIASITFQSRFGFMEKRTDIKSMIAGIEMALVYAGIIGQVPELHPWLIGNDHLMAFIAKIAPNAPNPVADIINITLDEIKKYDEAKGEKERGDFLAWVRAEMKSGKNRVTERDFLNHLSNNLLAGSDTTAISLRAIFYYLIKTPRTYQKLVEEIDQADANGMLSPCVTYAECLKLPYLQAVMKEALRIHPAVSFPLERYIPEGGATLCDVQLPAGTVVYVNPLVIHRNQDIFGKDAAEFRPERWIDADPEQVKLMERNFLAFGYGARTCIGKNISIMEMGKLVPQVLRKFDLEWASDQPEWTVKTYWFARQSGLIVRFKPR